MRTITIFAILSLLITFISWRTLFNTKSHGFYRFFGWECMAGLFAVNYKFWFVNPFSIHQLISWALLIYSAYLAVAGLIFMIKKGKPGASRNDEHLFGFEKTTELIDTGVFKRIRHPLYSSLIFLTWAFFLKNPTVALFTISLTATVFLYLTSRFDEKECLSYFGDKYSNYMKQTKMFIPYLF